MDICRECEQRHRHGEMDWPTDGHGEEYCRVHHGAHPGQCEHPDHGEREALAYEWAKSQQGYTGGYTDWLRLPADERAEYEAGAAGNGTL
jgi:hypothetical protein